MKNKIFILFAFFLVMVSLNLDAKGTASSIIVDVYGGLGFVSPGDINTKINDPDYGLLEFYESVSPLRWSKNVGFFTGYQFKYRYTLGVMFDYTKMNVYLFEESATKYSALYPNSARIQTYGYEFNSGGTALSIGPAFNCLLYSKGRLAFGAGLGILFAPKVSYYEEIAAWTVTSDTTTEPDKLNVVQGSGSAFGFLFNFTGLYYFTDYFGTSLNFGYKYLKASSLNDANGDVLPFRYIDGSPDDTGSPMSLNFSGLYFGLSLRLEFNLTGSSGDSWSSKDEGFHDELNTDWAPLEMAPSINELIELKDLANKQYQRAKRSNDAKKADRYRRLYDFIDRFEKNQWNSLSSSAKKDKIEKIKRVFQY